ncbi:hypothetical protein A9K97_gp322 [Tokyovirus A1]|uniref:hypothetical protein n=1 Tax=Tokyovirus A1 TaxID=1826170 RepID=UPI0007A96992|nr:hypothetical protein A9K97_gp322 [Tokyovirus A1]BAU80029.1 conserved hypothetical protein [Tokyovirus A1]
MERLVCVSNAVCFLTSEGDVLKAENIKEGDFLLSSLSSPAKVLSVNKKRALTLNLGGIWLAENQEIHVYKKPSPGANREKLFSDERKVDLCIFPQEKIPVCEYNPEKHSLYRRGVFWKFQETEGEPFSIARECAISGRQIPEVLLKNSRKTMEQALSGVLAACPTCLTHPPLTDKLRYSLGLGSWEGTKKTLDDICVGKLCSLKGDFFPSAFPKEQEVTEFLVDDVPLFLEDFTVI